ncbi:MAG TPA: hypothetical protein VEJ16_10505 [Alphaproteobacteria bacterium]|nr:hypothetical protein [Alphaproteobacteria bacterium]
MSDRPGSPDVGTRFARKIHQQDYRRVRQADGECQRNASLKIHA